MKNLIYFFLAICCGLFVSCTKWGSRENSLLMQQAQLLIEQMPDSALMLLNAVNTVNFSNAKSAEYGLLQIQARNNAGLDISSDTEIYGVREYFVQQKDPQKAAWACYFAALASSQNPTQAIEYQQEALGFAKIADNKELQGKILYNIGYLNFTSEWYSEAVIRYQQALKNFQSLNQYKREVSTLIYIASSLLMNHQSDSAQYYYQQALGQAQLHEDTAMQEMIYNNMSIAYRDQGQPDLAAYYCRQAFQLATSNDEKIYIYTNFAYIFLETGNADSAKYYIQLAETLINDIDNIYMTASLASLSYEIEKDAGNYPKALEYLERYSNLQIEILENNDRKLLLELQRKYDMTSKENELNKQRNKTWKVTGVSLAVLLALAVFSIYVLRINMKQKEALAKEQLVNAGKQLALEQAEREKMEKTMELENVIRQAQTLQAMYNQRDNELKTKFLEKIGIIKKIALLSPYLNESSLNDRNETVKIMMRTREIVKNLDLQNFIDAANELYPGFTGRLRQSYSELDDREVSICCLLLFDFNNQELDLFINRRLKSRLNTIKAWKTAIRRKMNIDSHGDIKSHLLGNLTP